MADDTLNFEVWPLPHVGTFAKRLVLSKWVETYSFNDRFNDLSDGVFTIPDDAALPSGTLVKDRLLKIDEANHANDVGSTIRVLRGSTPIMHQIVTRSEDAWNADEPTTKFTTEGLEWLFDRALVPAFNWATVPPQDFMYGVESILPNPGGEASIGSNTVMIIWNDATGGTFTLSDGVDTTSAINWNTDVNTLATRLETDIASIVDVRVSGAGTPTVPWVVEWINPAGVTVTLLTANDTGLTGETVGTRITYDSLGGQLDPTGWQKSIDPHTGVPHGQVSVLEASTDQAHTGTYSIRVVGEPYGTDFPGAQLLPTVTPGWTYRASIWVFCATATTFRLVMRTLDETFIAAVEVAVSASTWTELSIPAFVIPSYLNQIIFRIAPLHSSALVWYFDDWELAPGFEAATLGLMMSDVRTAALAAGAPLAWLTPTWTTTNDSDGAAWDEPRQWVVNHGQTFGQLIEYVRRWNYEHRIRWDVADNRFEWDMWNPNGGGQTRANIALTGKSGVEASGAIVRRPPNATYVLAESETGDVGEFASTTLDDVWGRLEKFHRDRQGVTSTELVELATRLVDRYSAQTASRVVTVADPSLSPWTSYEPGDTVTLNLAPKDTRQALRIAAIVVSRNRGQTTPRYDVHFGSPVYSTDTATAQGLQGGGGGSTAVAQGLRSVLRQFETIPTPKAQAASFIALPTAGTFSVFSLPGQAFVEVGRLRLQFAQAVTIIGVLVACNVAPTGASIIVDINKNATTVFPAQAGRPTIAASANASAEVAPQVSAVAAGEYLTVDIDQVGSTIPGGDLTVMVRWAWASPI